MASESCALDACRPALSATWSRVNNGVRQNGARHPRPLRKGRKAYLHILSTYILHARTPCWTASACTRPGCGQECLARRHPVPADVVIGVPDSGLDAAVGYSPTSGIPNGRLYKNKYIGRTFISPGQKSREAMVQLKTESHRGVVRGKGSL